MRNNLFQPVNLVWTMLMCANGQCVHWWWRTVSLTSSRLCRLFL